MLAIAEEQQAAVARLAEEAALAIEKLGRAVPAARAAAAEAAQEQVARGIAAAVERGTLAVQQATAELSATAETARNASVWLGWRAAALVAFSALACLAAFIVLSWIQIGSANSDLANLAAERAELTAQVAELRAGAAAWAAQAGRAQLAHCGDKARLCVKVVPGETYEGNNMVIAGY